MENNKPIIGILLGDPSGIGPELISKLLQQQVTEEANIIIIGEKNILHEADKITGLNSNVEYVSSYEQVKFNGKNKFFLDISKGTNHNYEISKPSSESGQSVLSALNCALDLANADKENSIMIGDSLEADIMGALKVGMKAIYCNFENEIINNNEFITVKSLLEIKQYL